MIGAISTALSGLAAAAKRVDAAASNIANISSSGALEEVDGPAPYSALTTVQTTGPGGSVQATNVAKEPGFVPAFDSGSSFANADGLVGVPNVDLAEEAVNLKLAETAYRASLSVIKTADELSKELLRTVDERA